MLTNLPTQHTMVVAFLALSKLSLESSEMKMSEESGIDWAKRGVSRGEIQHTSSVDAADVHAETAITEAQIHNLINYLVLGQRPFRLLLAQ